MKAAKLEAHPAANLFPLLQGEEFEALVDDIRANGLRVPITTFEGQVLDGRNRLAACKKAGVEPRSVEWKENGSPTAWVLSLNSHRRHLTPSQRAFIAAEALPLFEKEAKARQGKRSDLGADRRTSSDEPKSKARKAKKKAAGDSAKAAGASERSTEKAERVLKGAPVAIHFAVKDGLIAVDDAEKVLHLSREEQLERLDRVKAGTAPTLAKAGVTSAALDYDGDCWETPPEFLGLVREVLGTIDLDPASNANAQKRVKARVFFTKKEDGLTKQWHGQVFCNPPYSSPLIGQFSDKLVEEFEAKRTTEAIFLVNNCTDTGWCQPLMKRFVVCFTKGRIQFLNPDGKAFATRQGQAVFYLGANSKKFAAIFAPIGAVMGAL